LNKAERAQIAKNSARNWALDKVDTVLFLATLPNTLGGMPAPNTREWRAPEPTGPATNFREWQERQEYDYMQGTLTTVELALSFVPGGRDPQAGKLAAHKLPVPYHLHRTPGMPMALNSGPGTYVSFSEHWATGQTIGKGPPKFAIGEIKSVLSEKAAARALNRFKYQYGIKDKALEGIVLYDAQGRVYLAGETLGIRQGRLRRRDQRGAAERRAEGSFRHQRLREPDRASRPARR
jgi:hypothetical protein